MKKTDLALPLALGTLGVGYLVATYASEPPAADVEKYAKWKRHMADAKIALLFGVAASAVLFAIREKSPRPHRTSLA